jgi:hypothetical protein
LFIQTVQFFIKKIKKTKKNIDMKNGKNNLAKLSESDGALD